VLLAVAGQSGEYEGGWNGRFAHLYYLSRFSPPPPISGPGLVSHAGTSQATETFLVLSADSSDQCLETANQY
jgi:hypothetical protein